VWFVVVRLMGLTAVSQLYRHAMTSLDLKYLGSVVEFEEICAVKDICNLSFDWVDPTIDT
jgi:hypothetical protein